MAETPDPSELARRYLELWQQHLSQTANDPTLTAGVEALSKMMADLPGFGLAQSGNSNDDNARRAETASPSSDDSGGNLSELLRRVDALEKRLDALERGSGGSRKGAGKRPRKG